MIWSTLISCSLVYSALILSSSLVWSILIQSGLIRGRLAHFYNFMESKYRTYQMMPVQCHVNLLYDQIVCIAVHLRIFKNTYLMWRHMLVLTIVRCALTASEPDFKVLSAAPRLVASGPDWKVLADWCWEWLGPKGRGPKGPWAWALFHQMTLLVGALLCIFCYTILYCVVLFYDII